MGDLAAERGRISVKTRPNNGTSIFFFPLYIHIYIDVEISRRDVGRGEKAVEKIRVL